MEVRQAAAGREEAEQSLQQIQAQLEESKYNLEKLRSELLSQQEHSERGEAAAAVWLFFNLDLSKGKQTELFFRIALRHSLHVFTPGHSGLLGSFTGAVRD